MACNFDVNVATVTIASRQSFGGKESLAKQRLIAILRSGYLPSSVSMRQIRPGQTIRPKIPPSYRLIKVGEDLVLSGLCRRNHIKWIL